MHLRINVYSPELQEGGRHCLLFVVLLVVEVARPWSGRKGVTATALYFSRCICFAM
jgi:hypothetical protein